MRRRSWSSGCAGCTGCFEANYDRVLLEKDTRRPWGTKQRIEARHGHLSNEQAAELAALVAHDGLRQVVLGHLSRDCNEPGAAVSAVRGALHAGGWLQVKVECSCQDEPTGWFRFQGTAAGAAGAGEQGELF